MATSWDDLRSTTRRVRERFEQAACTLEDLLTAMKERGQRPLDAELGELRGCAEAFDSLIDDYLAVRPTDAVEPIKDLSDLEGRLDDLSAEARRRETLCVRPVLDRVLALRHSQPGSQLLLECHGQALALLRELERGPDEPTAGPADWAGFADGSHPLARLLRFVEYRDGLNDEEYLALESYVGTAFGSALRLAIVRNHLSSGPVAPVTPEDEEPSAAESIVHETPPAPEAQAAGATDVLETDSEPEPPLEEPDNPAPGCLPKEADRTEAVAETSTTSGQKGIPHEAGDGPAAEPAVEEPETGADSGACAARAYQSDPSLTAMGIAGLARTTPPAASTLGDLAWRLCLEDQLDLATLSSRCANWLEPERLQLLPPWLVRSVLIAREVRGATGPLTDCLRDDFAQFGAHCFVDGDEDWNNAIRLMGLAAALRPALLAPDSGAVRILHDLKTPGGLGAVHDYKQKVAGYGDLMQPIDPAVVKHERTQAAWEADRNSLRDETENWLAKHSNATIKFERATQVLHKWVGPGGLLNRLLTPVLRDDANRLEDVRKELLELKDTRVVRAAVNKADPGSPTGHKEIHAGPYDSLKDKFNEALAFAQRWADLQQQRPGRGRRHLDSRVAALREDLTGLTNHALGQLEGFEKGHGGCVPIRAGVVCCIYAIRQIRDLFDPSSPLPPAEADPLTLVQAPWLLFPGLALGPDWEVKEGDRRRAAENLLRLIAGGQRPWKAALLGHARTDRDYEATGRILTALRARPQAGVDVDQLAQLEAESLQDCRQALERDLEDTRKRIEAATALGVLRESDRNALADKVAMVQDYKTQELRLGDLHAFLKEVRTTIETIQQKEVVEAGRQLEELGRSPDDPGVVRVRAALDREDVLAANELIERLREGRELPPRGDRSQSCEALRRFFPEKAERLAQLVRDTRWSLLVQQVKDGGRIGAEAAGAVVQEPLKPEQRDQAVALLQTWHSLKSTRKPDRGLIALLMKGLGFGSVAVDKVDQRRRPVVDVTTEPIRGRDICPIPTYGSSASGRYRLVLDWESPGPEDLVNHLDVPPRGPALIVLYFDFLTVGQRRKLARLCRERLLTALVIDEPLLLHLASRPGTQLAELFGAALPFTYAEPYHDASGVVPPEMFYGRRRELRDTQSDTGTSFLYGGRQIGKTALLQHARLTFHQPEQGQLAVYIELKGKGFLAKHYGGRPPDDLRCELARTLVDLRALPEQFAQPDDMEDLCRRILAWLDEQPGRRLLTLLDEADGFLECDAARDFLVTRQLKALMDESRKRFKVVFAGLHNVLRASRHPNNPLLHLGTPLCIGPLLDEGEALEALNLIRLPLEALGYEFADTDLIQRILAQTNYYPSLIQIYGRHLLKQLVDNPAKFPLDETPPYTITDLHLKDAYQKDELRERIRFNLQRTLDLDSRYAAIAYWIAYGYIEDRRTAAIQGFPVSAIREGVLDQHGNLFQEGSTEDTFGILLDEMVGIGVLREAGPGHYTIRSPNVLTMLGTEDEILNELCRSHEPPPFDEPGTYRTAYQSAGQLDPARRNPLTYRQLGELTGASYGVSLLAGTRAAGLNDLRPFLEEAFNQDLVWMTSADLNAFVYDLGKSLDRRAVEGTTLFVVDASSPWEGSWVEAARRKLDARSSGKKFARVVFVADPQRLTAALQDKPPFDPGVLSLQPWNDTFVHHWLEECGLAHGNLNVRSVRDATGNWPSLLADFRERVRSNPTGWQAALQDFRPELNDPARRSRRLADFGLDVPGVPELLLALDDGGGQEIDCAFLAEYVGGFTEAEVALRVRWADLLQLVRPHEAAGRRVDPIVSILCRSGSPSRA